MITLQQLLQFHMALLFSPSVWADKLIITDAITKISRWTILCPLELSLPANHAALMYPVNKLFEFQLHFINIITTIVPILEQYIRCTVVARIKTQSTKLHDD